MLPCVCSVRDHRWRQNDCGKNKEVAHEPQAGVSLMFLPRVDVFCDLLLNRLTVTWNLFVLYNDQKSIKTDTHTCVVLLDCSKICASLVPSAILPLGLFSSLSYFHTVSSKSFLTSSLAQSIMMAKTFCKTASL